MNSTKFSEALSAWAQAIGEEKVVTALDANVTGLEREIPGILYPESTRSVCF